jgi:hypothetical protein
MKYINILIALSAALLLLSCQKETDGSPGGLPMRVVPTLAGGETKGSLTTDDLQEFWLIVDCPSDANYSYRAKFSKSGSAWTSPRQLYWKDKTTPIDYYALLFGNHSFQKDELTDGFSMEIPTDQSSQEGLNAADLLFFSASDITYDSTVDGQLPVNFKHGLTRVTLELSLGSEFFDNGYGLTDNPVTKLVIKGACRRFSYQPLTDTIMPDSRSHDADFTPLFVSYTPGTAASKTAVVTYEAILVPQILNPGDLKVSFNVGKRKYVWANTEVITLPAGRCCTLPVIATMAPTHK